MAHCSWMRYKLYLVRMRHCLSCQLHIDLSICVHTMPSELSISHPLQWCVINLSKCQIPLGSITIDFSTIYRHFAAKHVNSHQAKSIFTRFLWTQLFPFIKFLYNPSWGTKLLVWIFLPWVWRPCVNGCQCRVITKEKVYGVAGWGGILMVSCRPFCVSEDEDDRIWGKPMIYEWRFGEANVWFSPYTLHRIKQWSISDINDSCFRDSQVSCEAFQKHWIPV